MTSAQAERFVTDLECKLQTDSAEQTVATLAELVLMKDEFREPDLYRRLLKLVAAGLMRKTLES